MALTIALVLLPVVSSFSQNNKKEVSGHVYVVSSIVARGQVSAERLDSCLREFAQEWKQDERRLPSVVFLVVSPKLASAALVEGPVGIRRKYSPTSVESYYEVWMVNPTVEDYMKALEGIVEDYFQLKPDDRERKEVWVRVARVQNATVGASEGK